MFIILLLIMVVAAGVAVATGHGPDTRDPRYGVGPLLAPRGRPHH